MEDKAKQRAQDLGYGTDPLNRAGYTANEVREAFIEGYKQAEKDLELTWEDIADILDVTDVIANDDSMEVRLKTMSEEEYCQEVLKRFKERKEK